MARLAGAPVCTGASVVSVAAVRSIVTLAYICPANKAGTVLRMDGIRYATIWCRRQAVLPGDYVDVGVDALLSEVAFELVRVDEESAAHNRQLATDNEVLLEVLLVLAARHENQPTAFDEHDVVADEGLFGYKNIAGDNFRNRPGNRGEYAFDFRANWVQSGPSQPRMFPSPAVANSAVGPSKGAQGFTASVLKPSRN